MCFELMLVIHTVAPLFFLDACGMLIFFDFGAEVLEFDFGGGQGLSFDCFNGVLQIGLP